MTAPSAHCRRALALQRQIPSPSPRDGAPAGVWISDGLLASAFERYCRVSSSWNRKASNVPGPLESQRRLGRRRMADAGTWCGPPTPPAWAFPVPLNLSQWTWKPPSSSPSDRASLEHSQSLHDDAQAHAYTHTHSLGVAALLREWSSGRLHRAQEVVDDEMPVTSAAPVALPDESTSTAAAARKPASPLRAEMDDFRWAVMNADEETSVSRANNLSYKLRQLIVLGGVLPEDVVSFSVEVFQMLDSRLQSSPLRHQLSLCFCEAILGGVADSKVFTSDMLDVRVWNALLHELGKLPADDTTCDLLASLVAEIPAAHRTQVSSGVLSILGRFFSSWACSPAPDKEGIYQLLDADLLGKRGTDQDTLPYLPAYMRQASSLSQMLEAFAPEPESAFLLAAHRLVLAIRSASPSGRRALRYGWLYVLAQMPSVKHDFLFAAAAAFNAPSLCMTGPLTDAEICSLLMTQWSSRGFRSHGGRHVYRVYRWYSQVRELPLLPSLFRALSERRNPARRLVYYSSAWEFLTLLKKQDAVLQSLESAFRPTFTHLKILEALAFTSKDHRLVIRLRDLWTLLLNTHPHRHQRLRDWSPKVFLPYVRAIVADPDLPLNTIWRVTNICHFEGRRPDRKRLSIAAKLHRHLGTFGAARREIAVRAAVAFAAVMRKENPHMSRRSAVRHVSQAYFFIRALGEKQGKGEVPPQVFRAIYNVMTRDLWDGRPGVTKRLLWWLSTVEKQFGLEVAWECRLGLRRWRVMAKEIHRRWSMRRRMAVRRGVDADADAEVGMEEGKGEEDGGDGSWESEPARAAGHGGG